MQSPVTNKKIDLDMYSGRWYVIGTIPARFDKNRDSITETYTLCKDGNVHIHTAYRKRGQKEKNESWSKGFPIAKENHMHWKIRFFWFFKIDYLIEEVADDYSYAVVGHPKKRFLYIMNRNGNMNNGLYAAIRERCKQRGYDISRLRRPLQ